MPPLNIDILGNMFGSQQDPFTASSTTHKGILDVQSQKDVTDKLTEIARTLEDLNNRQRQIASKGGDYTLKEFAQEQKRVQDLGQGSIERALYKSGFGTGESQTGAASLVDRIAKTPEGDIQEVMRDFTRSTKEATGGMNDLMKALGGGFGGGLMASGMISGNPLRMLQGGLLTGASVWKAEGIKRKLETSALAGLAALSAFGDEAIRVAPESVSKATQMERALLRGGTTDVRSFFEMGTAGTGSQFLGSEQKLQFANMFAQTGGGSHDQLSRQMDVFTRFSVIYGEAATGLMQAVKKLDMWVPEGDFSKQVEGIANNLEQKGFAPQMVQEQIQSLIPLLIRQTQMGGTAGDLSDTISSSTIISTKTGLGGAMVAAGMQEAKGVFKGAMNDPSKFAFLVEKAGIDRDRAIGIANGTLTPTAKEKQRIAEALGDVTSQMGGGIHLQRAMFQSFGGETFGEELLRLDNPEVAQKRKSGEGNAELFNRIQNVQAGAISVEDVRIRKEEELIAKGTEETFQKLAKSIYELQSKANEITEKTGGVVQGIADAMNKILDGDALRVVAKGFGVPLAPSHE